MQFIWSMSDKVCVWGGVREEREWAISTDISMERITVVPTHEYCSNLSLINLGWSWFCSLPLSWNDPLVYWLDMFYLYRSFDCSPFQQDTYCDYLKIPFHKLTLCTPITLLPSNMLAWTLLDQNVRYSIKYFKCSNTDHLERVVNNRSVPNYYWWLHKCS